MTALPITPEALFLDGNRLMVAGDEVGAEAAFRQAIALAPHLAEAHANLGLLLDGRGEAVEAEACYHRAIALNPRQMQTHLNLGALLTGQKRFAEAEAAYRSAIALAPGAAAPLSNLGVLLACMKREAEAEGCYREAMALDAGYAKARFNLAYLLLRQGRYEEGWRCMEARQWYAPLENYMACPRWNGEPLAGKAVLIGFEAGHGDMIQFCRYAALLKASGAARVSVICHPGLKRLFATLDGLDEAIAFDEPFPSDGWDFWVPPLSLPFHFGTRLDSIPAVLPYLHPPADEVTLWADRLAALSPSPALRVGLVWKGNTRFENDGERSLPSLAVLAPLAAVDGVRFFSLQKGAGEDEASSPSPPLPLVDLAPQIGDFADTAAIVANLDLVIAVDTAVAHLAGALGKPCWVLLPDYMTDWRWLAERSDSPWYPQVMRLFRRGAMGDWRPVVAEVKEALQEKAAAHHRRPRKP